MSKIEKLKSNCRAHKKLIENLFAKLHTINNNNDLEENEKQLQLKTNVTIIKKKIATLEEHEKSLQNSITDEEELFLAMQESTEFELFCETQLSKLTIDERRDDISIITTESESSSRNVKLPKLVI